MITLSVMGRTEFCTRMHMTTSLCSYYGLQRQTQDYSECVEGAAIRC